MVYKKNSVINKNEFLAVSLVLIAISFMVFVFAATALDSPVVNGNYSDTLNISVSTDAVNNVTNVTCYYNASGGTATLFLVEILNDSAADTSFENASVGTSSLGGDATTYNISCSLTGDTNAETSTANITIDNTAPNVTFSGITNTVDGASYKSSIVINVSVSDATVGMTRGSVYFNITNSTGDQHNFTKASTSGGGYYNITVDTTKFTDGVYNITVYSNDSLGNENNTEIISVTFDDTAPSAVALTSSIATKTSLTITIAVTDATAGMNQSCTTDRSGASISGTTNAQTLTETGLSCGTSYQYFVQCTDAAGNTGSSAQTSFSTSSCITGGSSPSGSGVTATWTNTYTISDEQFEQGYRKELGANNRVRVRVTGSGGAIETHHVGIKEITDTTVTIEIASDPVEVELEIGEDAKVDVTEDGYYDIYVKLNSITSGKADITVQKISEAIPEGEEAVTTTGEIVEEKEEISEVEEEKDLTWLWVLIGILVLAVVIGGGVAVKKKK